MAGQGAKEPAPETTKHSVAPPKAVAKSASEEPILSSTQPSRASTDPNRAAAEVVFQAKGELTLEGGKTCRSMADLPSGEFVIQKILVIGCPVTDNDLRIVAGIRETERLREIHLWGAGFSDEGVKHLQVFTNLTHLEVCSPLTDVTAEQCSRFVNLLELRISGAKLTDTGVSHLRNLTNLMYVYLDATPITDSGLRVLAALPQLRLIYTTGDNITDAGLECVKGCSALQELDISNCKQITDAALESLKGLRNLKKINVSRTEITVAGVRRFKEARPDVDIAAAAPFVPLPSGVPLKSGSTTTASTDPNRAAAEVVFQAKGELTLEGGKTCRSMADLPSERVCDSGNLRRRVAVLFTPL